MPVKPLIGSDGKIYGYKQDECTEDYLVCCNSHINIGGGCYSNFFSQLFKAYKLSHKIFKCKTICRFEIYD